MFVTDPQGIKQIFTNTKEITAPGELNQNMALLGGSNGLPQLDGLRHKHRRKLLMSGFHGSRMRGYGQRICDLTEKLMSQYGIGKPFLAYPTMQAIALQVILDIWFGLHEGKRYQQLKQLIPSLLNIALSPLLGIFFSFPFLQKDLGRWSPWGYFVSLRRQFDELVYAEIRERRTQADPFCTDLLSELVLAQDEMGNPLTDKDVRDLLPSFLFAGRNTQASAISWALYWIHKQPAVREQLLQELDGLGESPDPMSIVGLPYLNAVCNEALRLYPVQIITLPRMVEAPVKMMGYELSPGTIVRGNIYLTHHREDLYPEPKQFKPERFLERQYSNHEFLPFGGGDRRCPGEALAQFEMKLVLATILSRYELALADRRPEQPRPLGINFRPARGLKMVILGRRQRQGQPQPIVANLV